MRLSRVYHSMRNLSLGVILIGTDEEKGMGMRRFTEVSTTGRETAEGCLFYFAIAYNLSTVNSYFKKKE